jgi:fructokinase
MQSGRPPTLGRSDPGQLRPRAAPTPVNRYGLAVRDDDRVSFVVIGEALIDLSPPGTDGSCVARPGGSPMNVAIGLARLGQLTEFAGRLSGDPFGTILRHHLERSAVRLNHVVAASEPSTIAVVEVADGHAQYTFSLGADFQWGDAELAFLPGGARAVHFGSLASWLSPGDAAIASAIRRVRGSRQVLVSYDPNIRPALQRNRAAARRQVEQSVRLAHVVKASAEDLSYLYRDNLDEVAMRWLALGTDLVVVTLGADGATAWSRGHVTMSAQMSRPVSRPPFRAEVVDTVGAGDAFTSGLLDSLARRDLLDPARIRDIGEPEVLAALLDDASRVASLTCSRAGADPPTRAEVDRLG